MSDDNMSDTSLADSLENSPVRTKRTYEDITVTNGQSEFDISLKLELEEEEEISVTNGIEIENEVEIGNEIDCDEIENGDEGSNSSKSSGPKEPTIKIQKKNDLKKGRLPILINRKSLEGVKSNFISRENLFQCSGDAESNLEDQKILKIKIHYKTLLMEIMKPQKRIKLAEFAE